MRKCEHYTSCEEIGIRYFELTYRGEVEYGIFCDLHSKEASELFDKKFYREITEEEYIIGSLHTI